MREGNSWMKSNIYWSNGLLHDLVACCHCNNSVIFCPPLFLGIDGRNFKLSPSTWSTYSSPLRAFHPHGIGVGRLTRPKKQALKPIKSGSSIEGKCELSTLKKSLEKQPHQFEYYIYGAMDKVLECNGPVTKLVNVQWSRHPENVANFSEKIVLQI